MPYPLSVSPFWPFAMHSSALKMGGLYFLHLAFGLANAVVAFTVSID